jgi:hypothetical protein
MCDFGRLRQRFDGDGLGSIAVRGASRREGTLRERFGGIALFRFDCRWHATRTGVGRVDSPQERLRQRMLDTIDTATKVEYLI